MPCTDEALRCLPLNSILNHSCVFCGYGKSADLSRLCPGLRICRSGACRSLFTTSRDIIIRNIPMYPRYKAISFCLGEHNRVGQAPVYSPALDIGVDSAYARQLLSIARVDFDRAGCPGCGFALAIDLPEVHTGMHMCGNRECQLVFFIAEELSVADRQARLVLTDCHLTSGTGTSAAMQLIREWTDASVQPHPRGDRPRWMLFSSGPGIRESVPNERFMCGFCGSYFLPERSRHSDPVRHLMIRGRIYTRFAEDSALYLDWFPDGVLYKTPDKSANHTFEIMACKGCAADDLHGRLERTLSGHQMTQARITTLFAQWH